MKTSTKLLLIGIFCMFSGMMTVQAQTSFDVSTTNGTITIKKDLAVTTDLVTKGTTVFYLVCPDPILNPNWLLASTPDAKVTTGIASTFAWTSSINIGTFSTTTSHFTEYTITGATGSTTVLSALEKTATCTAASTTDLNLKVVAAPTITGATVTLASDCAGGTDGSLAGTIPTFTTTLTVDGGITTPGIKVKATLVLTKLDNSSVTLFTDQVLSVDELTGIISGTELSAAVSSGKFQNWGKYDLTITAVSDKISRKDVTTDATSKYGYFNANKILTYSLLKTPSTGSIYHLPN